MTRVVAVPFRGLSYCFVTAYGVLHKKKNTTVEALLLPGTVQEFLSKLLSSRHF